jgi:hypothetical protein
VGISSEIMGLPNGETDMSTTLRPRYVVDEQGRPSAVLLEIEEYRRILEELEELEAIRAFDEAKASGDEAIPLEQALREIEQRPR